jgi:hypothetical protein
MALTCNRVSGKDGAFSGPSGVIAHVSNWNVGENAPVNSEARSNTQGFQITTVGARSANGGFNIGGTEPVIKLGDRGLFKGYTGGGTTKGRLYQLAAIVNQLTMQWDWQNRTSNSQYAFTSDWQQQGDELKILPATEILKDTSRARNFMPPMMLPADPTATPPRPNDFYPVLINGSPLCMQNATITMSAQPNQLADSCTGGWMTVLGLGATNVTFSGTATCNDTSQIPDIGTCNTLEIFTDICDLTKKWQFKYFMLNGKESLNVDIAGGGAVTYTINMTFSVACGCDNDEDGLIVDPNGVYWLGQAAA